MGPVKETLTPRWSTWMNLGMGFGRLESPHYPKGMSWLVGGAQRMVWQGQSDGLNKESKWVTVQPSPGTRGCTADAIGDLNSQAGCEVEGECEPLPARRERRSGSGWVGQRSDGARGVAACLPSPWNHDRVYFGHLANTATAIIVSCALSSVAVMTQKVSSQLLSSGNLCNNVINFQGLFILIFSAFFSNS